MHFEDVSSPFKEFFVFVEASCSLFLWLYPAQIFSISVRLLLFTFLYWLLFFPHLTPGHFCRFSVYYSFLWHNFLKSQLWIMCYWSHYLCAICSPGSSQMSLSIFFSPSLGYLSITLISVSLPLMSLLFYPKVLFSLQFLYFSQWNYQLVRNNDLKLTFK